MINSAAFPKVALSRPPTPWPRWVARCSVALPIQEASGMIARPEKMKIKTSLCRGPQKRVSSASGIKINSQFMQGAIVGWDSEQARSGWQVKAMIFLDRVNQKDRGAGLKNPKRRRSARTPGRFASFEAGSE